MGIFLDLNRHCFYPLEYLKGACTSETQKLLNEEERCYYYVPGSNGENEDLYITEKFNSRGYLVLAAMIVLLIPGILFGAIFGAVSLISKDVRTRKVFHLDLTPYESPYASSPEYNNVIRNIKNRSTLEKVVDLRYKDLQEIQDRDGTHCIEEIVNDFNAEKWDRFRPEDALLALKLSLITSQQFGTIMRYYSVAKIYKPEEMQVITLFDSRGSINLAAYRYIKQTLKPSKGNEEPFIVDNTLNLLFEEMRKLPLSEQRIFVIPEQEDLETPTCAAALFGNNHFNQTITKTLMDIGYNIFGRFTNDEGQEKRMVASIGLIQTLCRIECPDSYSTALPVIGLSSTEDIRNNGLTNTRDIAVAFPGTSLPKTADLFTAKTEHSFSDHDGYHLWTSSAIPFKQKQQFIEIGDLIKVYMMVHVLEQNLGLTTLCTSFYDMDFDFRHDRKKSNKSITYTFWLSVLGVLELTHIGAGRYLPSIKLKHEKDVYQIIIDQMACSEEGKKALKDACLDILKIFTSTYSGLQVETLKRLLKEHPAQAILEMHEGQA